jgi:hypothetical protein
MEAKPVNETEIILQNSGSHPSQPVFKRNFMFAAPALLFAVVIFPVGGVMWLVGVLVFMIGISLAGLGNKIWCSLAHALQGGLDVHGCGVLITGGNAGIGAATATHLAARGARVCIWGRNKARLMEVVDAIVASGMSI